MIFEFFFFLFFLFVAFLTAYLVRHYVFTFTALYCKPKSPVQTVRDKRFWPKVSILIPARNEEKVIGRILKRMTELTYPKEKVEIVVIDDASTDSTGEIAENFAKLHSQIKVIHRDVTSGGKGKPSALNEGLKHATGEIVFCFDADYHPQRDILEKLTACFVYPEVGAVQGRVTVLNEPETLTTRLVALERIGGYRVDQLARNYLQLIPQFGGTVGGFRRDLIESLGGWDPNMLAEDTDLTLRVYLAGFKIRYVNEAECYEEAVEDWRAYWQQRYRWARGHMQCAFKHLWPLLRCKKLRLREKIDGFFMLNVYFVPILAALAWIFGMISFFIRPFQCFSWLWAYVPLTLYSTVGNFAPFFEIGIGAYLDGRRRVCWLLPLLIITFFYNILICSKALVDLCISKVRRKTCCAWMRTLHNGRGNRYINSL